MPMERLEGEEDARRAAWLTRWRRRGNHSGGHLRQWAFSPVLHAIASLSLPRHTILAATPTAIYPTATHGRLLAAPAPILVSPPHRRRLYA